MCHERNFVNRPYDYIKMTEIKCIYISNRNSECNDDDYLQSEKLIQPIPIPLSENEKEEFPRPFGMKYKEPMPSVFGLSSTTEKITTIRYPQLGKYRHDYQPRNIEDILRHTIMNSKSYDRMNMDTGYHQSQHVPNYGPTSNHDPFYAYKPQDPSDVNLMATGSVRFAPPPWKNMNTNKHHYQKNSMGNHQIGLENSYSYSHRGITRDKHGRPLVVTLNIFPMTERDKMMMGINLPGQVSLLGKMIATNEYQGRIGNMLLRLNVFPDSLNNMFNIEKQDTQIQ